MRPTRLAVVLTALAVLCSLLGVVGSGAAQAATTAAAPPYGANNWSCRPAAARPVPVVLVHGTYGTMASYLQYLSWGLVVSGYCVYSLDYGSNGTDSIPTSAGQLKTFVDKVLASTGAAKVSIVGHSQGGTMARYYVKNLGGSASVDDLVSIAAPNHGTTNIGVTARMVGYPTCTACSQMLAGSSFLTSLNADDETPGSVSYTNVVTKYDRVVTPYTSGYLSGPSTTNIAVQNLCPADTVDHQHAPEDIAVILVAINALQVSGPAQPTYRPPRCTW